MIPDNDDESIVDSSVLAAKRTSTTNHGDTLAAETYENTSATDTIKATSNTESA